MPELPLLTYPAVVAVMVVGLLAVAFWPEGKETPVVHVEVPPAPRGYDPRLWHRCYTLVAEEHIPLADAGFAVTEDVIFNAANKRYVTMATLRAVLVEMDEYRAGRG